MSFSLAVGRVTAAAVFSASMLLTMTAAPSSALEPPRPLPGYRPTFVTEREPGPWIDCAWAAAAMLLDKWTNGTQVVDREHLRALSGDRTGGSNFADIRRAYARLGLDLRWSPSGGERISWSALIGRLDHGSGAILMGDYANMPRRYGRWDPSLRNNTGPLDDHALYLDGYDARTRRILVMDPLAPAGWHGEWIPASVLRKFAWHTGSAIWTATTPTAAAAPFAGVKLGPPSASGAAGAVSLSWPVDSAPKGWSQPGFSASMTAEPIGAPDPAAIDVAAFPATTPVLTARTSVAASAGARSLEATIPVPATPGLYRMMATLTDDRFGRAVATAGPFDLYVPGPRAWNLVAPDDRTVVAGGLTSLSIVVANVGTETWADLPAGAAGTPAASTAKPRNTRLVGTWLPPAGLDDERAGSPVPPDVDFGLVPLGPGYVQIVDRVIQVPIEAGAWRLELRVADDLDGPDAFIGSAPGVVLIDIGASDTSLPPQ